MGDIRGDLLFHDASPHQLRLIGNEYLKTFIRENNALNIKVIPVFLNGIFCSGQLLGLKCPIFRNYLINKFIYRFKFFHQEDFFDCNCRFFRDDIDVKDKVTVVQY